MLGGNSVSIQKIKKKKTTRNFVELVLKSVDEAMTENKNLQEPGMLSNNHEKWLYCPGTECSVL